MTKPSVFQSENTWAERILAIFVEPMPCPNFTRALHGHLFGFAVLAGQHFLLMGGPVGDSPFSSPLPSFSRGVTSSAGASFEKNLDNGLSAGFRRRNLYPVSCIYGLTRIQVKTVYRREFQRPRRPPR